MATDQAGNTDDQALAAFRDAYAQLVTAIEAASPDQGLAVAHGLVEFVEEIIPKAARLRARQALRVWEANELSLQQLGDRIGGGVSKARADQLLKLARLTQIRKEP